MSFEKAPFKSVFSRDTFKKFENFKPNMYFEDTFKFFEFKLKMSLEEKLFKNSENEKVSLEDTF